MPDRPEDTGAVAAQFGPRRGCGPLGERLVRCDAIDARPR